MPCIAPTAPSSVITVSSHSRSVVIKHAVLGRQPMTMLMIQLQLLCRHSRLYVAATKFGPQPNPSNIYINGYSCTSIPSSSHGMTTMLANYWQWQQHMHAQEHCHTDAVLMAIYLHFPRADTTETPQNLITHEGHTGGRCPPPSLRFEDNQLIMLARMGAAKHQQ